MKTFAPTKGVYEQFSLEEVGLQKLSKCRAISSRSPPPCDNKCQVPNLNFKNILGATNEGVLVNQEISDGGWYGMGM